MSARPRWSYVQARLQARHGERLTEADWRALEAARSLDRFLERARASSLRRFAERLNARMPSRAIECALRDAWRSYAVEIASWVPAEWRAAVEWTQHLPDLPAIDALLKGEVPGWARQDPAFAAFIENDPRRRTVDLARSPFAPLVPAHAEERWLPARWDAHWRSLWPQRDANGNRALEELAAAIAAHIERLGGAGPQETSARYRRDLAFGLTRMFRRHGGSAAAVFSHLALVALDLERLRGGLVRRRLFEPGSAQEAA